MKDFEIIALGVGAFILFGKPLGENLGKAITETAGGLVTGAVEGTYNVGSSLASPWVAFTNNSTQALVDAQHITTDAFLAGSQPTAAVVAGNLPQYGNPLYQLGAGLHDFGTGLRQGLRDTLGNLILGHPLDQATAPTYTPDNTAPYVDVVPNFSSGWDGLFYALNPLAS